MPNFAVAHCICSKCESEPVTSDSKCTQCGSRCELCNKFDKKEKEWERNPCEGWGKRQVIFSGPETKEKFCKWLINEQHRNSIVIAHNARAYDAYFIYDYLMKNGIIPEPSIFNGSKIMFMKVSRGLNIRILDSLNFLPMPLANLPKSFGLTELKKGYFPHFYNTKEHQSDVLSHLPDMKYYDPDGMSTERRKDFFQWYEAHRNDHFDFQKEMQAYCISNVDILLKACWKFRELLRSETGEEVRVEDEENMMMKTVLQNAVDPFSYLTIASVCMGVFRSKFLKEEWSVLLEERVQNGCKHEVTCECEWLTGRRWTATSPLEVFHNGEWVDSSQLKIVKEKFVKSAIGLIPCHGYSGRDNHSKESIEWIKWVEKEWCDEGKPIVIQHARNKGEKIITCKGKTKSVRYKVDGYFEYQGRKYVCEYHGCNFHGCTSCYLRDRETTLNDNKTMAQRYRETMLKEKRLQIDGYIVLSKWSCQFAKEKKKVEVQKFLDSLQIQEPINLIF